MSFFDISPININISTNSSSPTPEQSLLSAVGDMAKDNPDLARKVKGAAEKAEREHKERIEKALEGSVELDLLKGPQGKRFVVKHFHRGKECSVYGTAYPGYDADHEDNERENKGITVLVLGDRDPILYNGYSTISALSARLENCNSPHVIKFFD